MEGQGGACHPPGHIRAGTGTRWNRFMPEPRCLRGRGPRDGAEKVSGCCGDAGAPAEVGAAWRAGTTPGKGGCRRLLPGDGDQGAWRGDVRGKERPDG